MKWSWTPSTRSGLRTCAAVSAATITLLEFWFLIAVDGWIDILSGVRHPIDIPKWVLVTFFMIIYAANYYPLSIRGYGISFDREFRHFKRAKQILLLTSSLVALVALLAFFIYSAIVHRHYLGIHD